MRPLFVSEPQVLRRMADAWPGRGTLTLLGAPVLAVIATFWFQPKASGSETLEPEPRASSQQVVSAPNSDTAVDEGLPAPFRELARALELEQIERARELLAEVPSATSDQQILAQAYSLMLKCRTSPSNDTTARAFRFYLEQAPNSVRAQFSRACLAD